MTDSESWTYHKEANTELWTKMATVIQVVPPRGHKSDEKTFLIQKNGWPLREEKSTCEAYRYLYNRYGIIPRGSIWYDENANLVSVVESDGDEVVVQSNGEQYTTPRDDFESFEFIDAGAFGKR